MSSYGTQTILTGGRGLRASADGNPRWKVGGVTLDTSLLTAVTGSDATLADGRIAKIGQKYIRYGTVLTKVTASGKFAPYNSLGVDGTELLNRGDCFILDETVIIEQDLASDHPAVFDGGRVFAERVTDVAGAPTLGQLEDAFPAVTWVRD